MASVLLESRSYRPFKSSEEYLEAMREDLAEWLNTMYPDLRINAENFMNRLDTGVALCKHANNVRQSAEDYVMRRQARNKSMTRSITTGLAGPILAMGNVHYLPGAKRGTFFARDNVSNFITWCRQSLKIFECLLFETDDLIMRKNEKHVILCLLEVARRGSKFGMLAPMLVQMERQIDREIAADNKANGVQSRTDSYFSTNEVGTCTDGFDSDSEDEDEDGPPLMYGPQPQIITNDLKSLDEMVRDLVEKCTCPSQFPMVRVSEGKYRIGDTKVLIFVRILRSHVMVRVGGGWDTLAHYLDKHDPCRCKAQHRSSVAARLIPRVNNQTNGIELHKAQVIYERSPPIARRVVVSPSSTPNNSLISPNTTNDSSNGSTLSPPPRQSRSRSPTPQRRLKSTFADSSMKCNQATLSPCLARRSASPSPRRIAESRKKQVTTDGTSSTVKPSHRPTMEGDQVDHKPLSENGASNVEGSNKFENISDNGSEISDEGYRSLGLIQTAGNKAPNVQRLESLQNQNSVDDADCIAPLDQTSSDSQNPSSSSPTLESYKSDSFDTVDWKKDQENPQPSEPKEPLPKQQKHQRRNSDNFVGNRDASNSFEMSGVFITNDQITVDMGKVPTSRKNSLNSDTLSNTSKIPRGPAQGKRHSIDACSDCGSDMSQRSGLPLRSKPVYRSVRKPNERKEKSKHDTWNGRGISGTTKKRPTISNDTFTSPTKDFVRNSSSRSSHNLYDENGRISRKNSSSLTTLPDKMNKTSSKNTSPLAQQLLEAAGTAKNDAQILEKMKDLLAKYSNGSFSPTNSSAPRKNEYDDFTTAWVHSNGTLGRANSCSPIKRGSFKPASEASSSESTQGRDASVIISPRRDRGASRIPAPVSHNPDLC